MSFVRAHLSLANVVSLLALFVALGGSATAALGSGARVDEASLFVWAVPAP